MTKTIQIDYVPRAPQAVIHQDSSRFRVVVAHRRFGKTLFSIAELLAEALRCTKKNPRYAFLAPLHKQAKLIAWDYLQAMCRDLPGYAANQAELRVDFFGGRRISLFGADNPDALRGQYLDGCVMDEYAQMDPRTWTEVLRPALSDRKGWAVWIGTPAGPNQFRDIYDMAGELEGWSRYLYTARDTGLIDEDELAAVRREMPEEAYEQEYMCSFQAAIRGAYYGKLMSAMEAEGRITAVPHDPAHQVETWWDLGVRDATTIWFAQRIGAQVRIIDLYSNTGSALDHYAGILREKPYLYSRHIAPHDINVRELGSGNSRIESARALGLEFQVAPRLSIEDGINAVRNMLPRVWIDREKCKVGIEAMQLYRAVYNEKHRVFQSTPLHDWTSDFADSMRYGAIAHDYSDWGDVSLNRRRQPYSRAPGNSQSIRRNRR